MRTDRVRVGKPLRKYGREIDSVLHEAAQVCGWCVGECIGDEEMEACARLCRDAADIASLHARFMARDSDYSTHLAEVCVTVCEACADECDRHDADHCQVCADVVRECADSCRSQMTA